MTTQDTALDVLAGLVRRLGIARPATVKDLCEVLVGPLQLGHSGHNCCVRLGRTQVSFEDPKDTVVAAAVALSMELPPDTELQAFATVALATNMTATRE